MNAPSRGMGHVLKLRVLRLQPVPARFPLRYRLPARFDTIPSRPSSQALAKTSAPSARASPNRILPTPATRVKARLAGLRADADGNPRRWQEGRQKVRAIACRVQLRLCARYRQNARAAEKGAGRDHGGCSRTCWVHLGNRSQRGAANDRSLRRAATLEATASASVGGFREFLRRFRGGHADLSEPDRGSPTTHNWHAASNPANK